MFVFKIAQRILQRARTSIVLSKTGEKALLGKHLDSIADSKVKSIFTSASKVFNNGNLEERQMYYSMVEDIIQKLKMCPDEKVRASAIKIMKESKGKSNQEIYNSVCQAENLLDSVNVAEGKYCSLFNAKRPMGKIGLDKKKLNEQLENLNNAIASGETKKAEEIAEGLYWYYSEPRQAYHALKRSGKLDEILTPEFELTSRFSRMKEYIVNAPEDTDMANYLYKKYFINEIKKGNYDISDQERKEIIDLLSSIDKRYNTKVFLDDVDYSTIIGLENLQDELNIWKKISGGQARLPMVYESNRYAKPRMINSTVAGDAQFNTKHIRVKNIRHASEYGYSHINRHEIGHLNYRGSDDKIVIPEAQKIEMERAGIPKESIEYGETNINEKVSVILEGYMSSYSQSFKDEMINVDGMPRYMTELCSHSEFFEKALRKKYTDIADLQTIECIKAAFDGKLPPEVSKVVLKDKTLLTVVDDVLREEDGNFLSGKNFIRKCKLKLDELAFRKEEMEYEAIRAKIEKETSLKKTALDKLVEEIELLSKELRESIAISTPEIKSPKAETILDKLKKEQLKQTLEEVDDIEVKTYIDLHG